MGYFTDTSLITCAEYQSFLDEQRAQGKYYQPDHWKGYRFSPGQGNTPVLGIRSSDASTSCEWLTDRETDAWRYRLPAPGELQQTGDENILNSFPTGAGYWSNTGFLWFKEPLLLPRNVIQRFIDRDLARDLDLAYNNFQKKSFSKRDREEIQRILDGYLDIYITLAILEERIQGGLPACEGILIVKERKRENA